MSITAIVDPVTNTFCEDGMKPGRIVVAVPDNPDFRLHRYSGDPLSPFRDATDQELVDAKKAALEQQALDLFNQQPLMKALVTVLSKQTKLTPAAFTDLVIEQHIKNLSPQADVVPTSN